MGVPPSFRPGPAALSLAAIRVLERIWSGTYVVDIDALADRLAAELDGIRGGEPEEPTTACEPGAESTRS